MLRGRSSPRRGAPRRGAGGISRGVDKVALTIHGGKKATADAALHQLYFGSLTPAKFKRPILGGDRQKVFDAFNSLCAKAYGGLKSFAHDHPELDLASDYAESFFKGSAGSTHGQTVAQTATAAAQAQAKAAKAQARHDAALKAAAAKEAALKDRQQKKDAAKAAAKDAAGAARAAKEAAKKKPRG